MKEKCGHDVALFGGLDPCYVFDRDDPEVVEKPYARRLSMAVEAVKRYGVYGRDL